jgi:hypothetical protein
MRDASSFLSKTIQTSQMPNSCGWYIEDENTKEESITANWIHFKIKISISLGLQIYAWITY